MLLHPLELSTPEVREKLPRIPLGMSDDNTRMALYSPFEDGHLFYERASGQNILPIIASAIADATVPVFTLCGGEYRSRFRTASHNITCTLEGSAGLVQDFIARGAAAPAVLVIDDFRALMGSNYEKNRALFFALVTEVLMIHPRVHGKVVLLRLWDEPALSDVDSTSPEGWRTVS